MRICIDVKPGTARRAGVVGVTLLVAGAAAISYAVPVKFEKGATLTHTQLNQNFDDIEARLAALEKSRWILTGSISGVGPSLSKTNSLLIAVASAPGLTLST